MTTRARRIRQTAAAIALASALTFLGFGSTGGSAIAAGNDWSVVDLQPLPGHTDVSVQLLDNHGRAVGYSDGGDNPAGVRWDTEGVPTELTMPDGCSFGLLGAMNQRGDVVALARCGGTLMSVLLPAEGAPERLEAELFVGFGISEGRLIAGQLDEKQAAVRVPGHGIIPLQDEGCDRSYAMDVSDAGLVVGTCFIDNQPIAVGWYGPYVFPLLPGLESSWPLEVTESGVILLSGTDATGTHNWFLSKHGTSRVSTEDLDENPAGITEYGVVAGNSGPTSNPLRDPKLYVYGVAVDARTLAPSEAFGATQLGALAGINERLEVIGRNPWTADGPRRSWLLRPPGIDD